MARGLAVDETILAALEKLSRVLRFLHQEVGKPYGLTTLQVEILSYLERSSGRYSGVTQIAGEFDLTKATVSDAVSTLERKRLISKQPLPQDGRRHHIEVTSRGKSLARMLPPWNTAIRKHLGKFSGEEKQRAMRFLMELIATMREAGLISMARMCLTCENFVRSEEGADAEPHWCTLLARPVGSNELRMNCNGYVRADGLRPRRLQPTRPMGRAPGRHT